MHILKSYLSVTSQATKQCQEHGKHLLSFSKMPIKSYLNASFSLSACLGVCTFRRRRPARHSDSGGLETLDHADTRPPPHQVNILYQLWLQSSDIAFSCWKDADSHPNLRKSLLIKQKVHPIKHLDFHSGQSNASRKQTSTFCSKQPYCSPSPSTGIQ